MERVYPVERRTLVRNFCSFLCCRGVTIAKAVRQFSSRFAYVDLLTSRAGYVIDNIYGDACQVVSDFNGSIGSSDLNHVHVRNCIVSVYG